MHGGTIVRGTIQNFDQSFLEGERAVTELAEGETPGFFSGFLSGSSLKWIAVAAMFLNHFGDILLKAIITTATYSTFTDGQFSILMNCYNGFHAIGRISMPIFCFFIVEGFLHSRHIKRYFLRLLIFALVSEIPYDLAFGSSAFDRSQQNVMFTLAAGLGTLILMSRCKKYMTVQVFIAIIAAAVASALKFDGGYYGILMIALFYLFRRNKLASLFSVFLLQVLIVLYFHESFDLNSVMAVVPLILIYCYSGKRGMNLKYLFYGFYPLHLLILALVTRLVIIPFYS